MVLENEIKRLPQWSKEADVVVVGYGYAGGCCAIDAHDARAKVLILEKMPNPGGSSVLSGGAINYTDNVDGAIQYLEKTQGGRCNQALIKVMAQGMHELPEYVEKLARTDGATVTRQAKAGGPYPFPGTENLGRLFVTHIPEFKELPWITQTTRPTGNGPRLMKLLMDNVEARGIEVLFSSPASELVTDAGGAVVGVIAEIRGQRTVIKAKRAVILASGGFEFNEKLKMESFEALPVYSMGNPGNTGEGILMAQKVGASLWHMWHFHGSYGFKFPEIPCGIRVIIGGPRNNSRRIAWINVDRYGKRFMNEYHPSPQDTMHRPLEYYDPDIQDYPRVPCHLIFDERGRQLEPIGDPRSVTPDHAYQWSRDNSKEIEKGWISKADTIADLAKKIGVEPSNLEETVNKWNSYCELGQDREFHRPPGTMMSISTPPFYSIQAWPICTNTQGGPEHNEKQQILDPYGEPIPRLYATGELGSFYGHLYLLGGNISECLVGGRIAGKNAASEIPWD